MGAEPRLGRRTALTFPLLPPPQKNRSLAVGFSPDTPTPDSISSLCRTAPVCGSTCLKSLSSPSEVPCQSSASIQVTPVTKRRTRWCARSPLFGDRLGGSSGPDTAHPEHPFGPGEPRAAAGRRDRGEHLPGVRIDLLDATLGELKQVPAVEGRTCRRGDIDRAHHLPARRIEGVQLVSGGNQTR